MTTPTTSLSLLTEITSFKGIPYPTGKDVFLYSPLLYRYMWKNNTKYTLQLHIPPIDQLVSLNGITHNGNESRMLDALKGYAPIDEVLQPNQILEISIPICAMIPDSVRGKVKIHRFGGLQTIVYHSGDLSGHFLSPTLGDFIFGNIKVNAFFDSGISDYFAVSDKAPSSPIEMQYTDVVNALKVEKDPYILFNAYQLLKYARYPGSKDIKLSSMSSYGIKLNDNEWAYRKYEADEPAKMNDIATALPFSRFKDLQDIYGQKSGNPVFYYLLSQERELKVSLEDEDKDEAKTESDLFKNYFNTKCDTYVSTCLAEFPFEMIGPSFLLGDNRIVTTFKNEQHNGMTYGALAAAYLECTMVSNFTSATPEQYNGYPSNERLSSLAKGPKGKELQKKWQTIYSIFNRQMICCDLEKAGFISSAFELTNGTLRVTYVNHASYPISVTPRSVHIIGAKNKIDFSSKSFGQPFVLMPEVPHAMTLDVSDSIQGLPIGVYDVHISSQATESPQGIEIRMPLPFGAFLLSTGKVSL